MKNYIVVRYINPEEIEVVRLTADEIRKDEYRKEHVILEDTNIIKGMDNLSFDFTKL